MTTENRASPINKECTVCGDTEPFHVHDGDNRIENYFTVGRGQTDFQAAQAWQSRALAAEKVLRRLRSNRNHWMARYGEQTIDAYFNAR